MFYILHNMTNIEKFIKLNWKSKQRVVRIEKITNIVSNGKSIKLNPGQQEFEALTD